MIKTKKISGPKDEFMPYLRDEKLSRPWAIPGVKDLEHRIGGLETEDLTGNVSYDPINHEKMVNLRNQKVEIIANEIPDFEFNNDWWTSS